MGFSLPCLPRSCGHMCITPCPEEKLPLSIDIWETSSFRQLKALLSEMSFPFPCLSFYPIVNFYSLPSPTGNHFNVHLFISMSDCTTSIVSFEYIFVFYLILLILFAFQKSIYPQGFWKNSGERKDT